MSKINWGRLVVGGIVASVIAFITDGLLHESIVSGDWKAVYANLGATEPAHNSAGMVYFAVFELGRGFVAMFLYVLMRPHWKPGPTTAALAGVAAWIAFSLTGPAQFIPLGFFSNALWGKVAAFQLITSIVAAIAGAALYKDALGPAASFEEERNGR
ncbi:MAG: hypothetical protein LC775_10775 [Acidobacteria bacterium]|nr:hypothetical protein [Acidobacteriota bacterium]